MIKSKNDIFHDLKGAIYNLHRTYKIVRNSKVGKSILSPWNVAETQHFVAASKRQSDSFGVPPSLRFTQFVAWGGKGYVCVGSDKSLAYTLRWNSWRRRSTRRYDRYTVSDERVA